ncbi:phosphoenolpyruvate carboxylase [Mucilaginibacter myungsuensis]|uniref:Phosphoenolpyruvate carboxylase n=1 Tax=Mucilaginibacter myungsuensis TaxID=649104 RepID=A0A929L2C0_9SPHI|nr:phosphoenolpyruvate carboxylase [Mucilaginibacter myungsuensis]MBE9664343.1 phosphoenolpyruvate carboxylase [Mucilaginibacter myungsuensis]MDN3597053.1 phosphoenolpyruvate carboxylase [Mucilaginibacter myungsuensis]
MPSTTKLSQRETIFNQEVESRFQLYDSLFLTLPFYQVKDTGILLPFFSSHCEKETIAEKSPSETIESFFKKYVPGIDQEEQINRLFRFIQYIERQVVLFDAIEDSAFDKLGNFDKSGTLQTLIQQVDGNEEMRKDIEEKLRSISLRLVLTAHPTQFYPSTVLGIMTDLIEALKTNDIQAINLLLQQLGKTPFFNKKSPTPVDEAISLVWFLENVFYHAVTDIQRRLSDEFDIKESKNQIVELGFWPGGDRDGNPNVTTESTRSVAAILRQRVFRSYYRDFRILKRRVTFRGVETAMAQLEAIIYPNAFNEQVQGVDLQDDMLSLLNSIRDVLNKEHDGLSVDLVEDMIYKVQAFGCYFATLDIRQDSRVLRSVFKYCTEGHQIDPLIKDGYLELSEKDKLKALTFNEGNLFAGDDADDLTKDTLNTIRLMKAIQQSNGQKACQRFIISNCQQASDILQLIDLFLWSGWTKESLTVDFMPLFETVGDLKVAAEVMERLYEHPYYQEHLKRRGNKQTIMLGFSDSTKDGGYLMANWSIYKAKVELTAMARKHGIQLAFFDGRGGPPARGGGKTHRFYASMGNDIANDHIQITIQGQTVSSQYGSVDTARFNSGQLINAGLVSALNPNRHDLLDSSHKKMISEMADESYATFLALREDPLFIDYLEEMSPLKLLSRINISSRPTKRNADAKLKLEDLRAISFVTSWGQMKQNIPGFFGVGSALKKMKTEGKWAELQKLYTNSGYFKTVIDNCMMSMSKSDFRVTAHLAKDKKFGAFWNKLKNEYELTKSLTLELTGNTSLMSEYPIEKRSIALRERIVLPLTIIQHYAINKLNDHPDDELTDVYKKLIIRTVYGVVNAGRNSA